MSQERISKGKSLIDFPSTYVVIDIETTGRSPKYDEIIELSAIRVSEGVITDQFSSLVQPTPKHDGTYLDNFIVHLTGITDNMLASAPRIIDILPNYIEFLSNDILVGHNINFDINFLYDNSQKILAKPLANDFIDTLRLTKKLHTELPSHKLSDLAALYALNYTNAHRALADCFITHECFEHLRQDILEKYGSIQSFANLFQKSHSVRSADITASTNEIDTDNPLYGKVFVFTGVLEKMKRKEAMQIVADHGGINSDSIKKTVNYLVLGNNAYCSSTKEGKSNKQKRAEELKLKGYDIDVIPESVFYDMIADN